MTTYPTGSVRIETPTVRAMDTEMGADDAIDHHGPLAPYRQLAAILTARIQRGDWLPGRPIPSEVRLGQEYELARSTVRRSVKLLVEDGAVFVSPGRGTYVAAPETPLPPEAG